ncbi:MAG: hypothetical protein M3430_12610 [Acidobacteriota bacterium]|nr:hypothetical protein [Acidobacteriota bacterium]
MSPTLHAIFDGEVLRIEEKAELELNARYKIILERESEKEKDGAYPLTALLNLSTDMGVEDLAANHSGRRT